jgi:hypothetical protein
MAKTKKEKPRARALPPITQAQLDQFKRRAREGIADPKAEYDYAAALFVNELKKQKYSERARKGVAKKWWKENIEDLCPWKYALKGSTHLQGVPYPGPEGKLRGLWSRRTRARHHLRK